MVCFSFAACNENQATMPVQATPVQVQEAPAPVELTPPAPAEEKTAQEKEEEALKEEPNEKEASLQPERKRYSFWKQCLWPLLGSGLAVLGVSILVQISPYSDALEQRFKMGTLTGNQRAYVAYITQEVQMNGRRPEEVEAEILPEPILLRKKVGKWATMTAAFLGCAIPTGLHFHNKQRQITQKQ